ncbi:helix-turn-helix domain-containing protein [Mammaliicoccus sciuri]
MEKITLTVNEVAALIGVGNTTIYTMVRQGEIPHKKVRGRILFHRGTIEKWVSGEEENETKIG